MGSPRTALRTADGGNATTLLLAAVALVTAPAVGAAIGLGYGDEILVALGASLALVAVGFLIANAAYTPAIIPFLLASGAVLVITWNGVRLAPSATVSDVLLAAAIVFPLPLLALVQRNFLPRIPPWLLIGSAIIVTSALIREWFPPRELPEIFQSRSLTTGEVLDESSLLLAARLIIAVTIVPLVIGLLVTTWDRARMLINLWLAGVAISSLVAALSAFGGVDLQETLTGQAYSFIAFNGEPARYVGLTVHPTHLGLTAAMAMAIVLVRMDGERAWRHAPLLGLYALAVLVSGARVALVGVVVAFAYLIVTRPATRKPLLTVAGLAAAAAYVHGAGATSFSTVSRTLGNTSSVASSNTRRLDAFQQGWDAFIERPIVGFGFEGLRGAHNVVLALLSSGGVIAFAGYVVIIVGAIRLGRAIRPHLPADLQRDALGILIALGVWIVASMVQNTMFDRFLYVPIALILGLWFALQRESRGSALMAQSRPGRGSGATTSLRG